MDLREDMNDVIKYPRTQHIQGSRLQRGDDLEDVPFESLVGKHLVVEAKVDGANCGVSFDECGEMLLQSRGHFLRGGPREKQFQIFKQWTACHKSAFRTVLGSRYVMYGEWLSAKHTIFYDDLPHYFLEFDVYDKERETFLSTPARELLLHGHLDVDLNVESVEVLYEGPVESLDALKSMIRRDPFFSDDRRENLARAAEVAKVDVEVALAHTDLVDLMEGLYVKWEEDDIVKGRYKFVRESFTNAVLEQEEHWHDRPIICNRLREGALERMFEQ